MQALDDLYLLSAYHLVGIILSTVDSALDIDKAKSLHSGPFFSRRKDSETNNYIKYVTGGNNKYSDKNKAGLRKGSWLRRTRQPRKVYREVTP